MARPSIGLYGMYKDLFFPILVSFIVTFLLTRRWIKMAPQLGLTGKDMNKNNKPEVAEGGGIWVIFGSTLGLLSYIFILVYISDNTNYLTQIFAVITLLLLTGLVGLFDDILGWKKGLSPIEKPLYTFLLAIPIVVIKAGYSTMNLPLIGQIDFGLLYPLLLVPIGIMGAANGFNMLAGYNGLEAIMGILLLLAAGLEALKLGLFYIFAISIIVISSILAFFIFNKYPSQIFPGNSFTHAIGALYATLVILGNFEKFGVLVFSLYFIELILFIRGLKNGVYKENFGIPDKNNCLKEPYDKIYSITHLAIKILRKVKGCAKEKEVVALIATMQLAVILIAFILQGL